MIQLLGSFWGQPASAMKPGTLAVAGTPYTPDRSASLSRMPVAASALWSGFGACASPVSVISAASSAPQMACSFRFILSPRFLNGLVCSHYLEQAGRDVRRLQRSPYGSRKSAKLYSRRDSPLTEFSAV